MAVEISGLTELLQNLNGIGEKMKKATDRGVVATASEVQREAVLSINNVVRGYEQVRSRSNKGKMHDVSPPGEAPNTDTGKLVESINVSHVRGSMVAYVYSNLDYGTYLEEVLNRPWLGPALRLKGPNLRDNIREALLKL